MHIGLNNDIALQMECDYGRIRMPIDIENDAEIRYLICLQCNYHNLTKGGVKVHLARKRNNMPKRYDLQCPLCPKNIQGHRVNKPPHIQKATMYTLKKIHILVTGKTFGRISFL